MNKALSYSPFPARPLNASDRTWFRQANRAIGCGRVVCVVGRNQSRGGGRRRSACRFDEREWERPLPHGLMLDASSTTFVGAGEGNRALVISLEGHWPPTIRGRHPILLRRSLQRVVPKESVRQVV